MPPTNQIDIATGGMNEVIATDGRQVTVTADDRYIQFRVVNRDAQRERQRPAMCRMV